MYGNRDCQASKGFEKHVVVGHAGDELGEIAVMDKQILLLLALDAISKFGKTRNPWAKFLRAGQY